MPLVLVMAGEYPGVCLAQLERSAGIALQVDGFGFLGERNQREHLPAHLHHRNLLSERIGLFGARQTETDRQQLVARHGISVAPRGHHAIRAGAARRPLATPLCR